MLMSGLIVLCFVIYHILILQFTLLVTDPRYRELHDLSGRHDVYRMLILGFSHPLVSLFYVVALFLLTAQLSHGFASVVQTLGINNMDQGEDEGPTPDELNTEASPPPMDSYPQGTLPRADDIPTAKPGKNGIVESPFVPGKPVDIQGYPPGATVRDPYTNKIFIVPIPTPTPNH